MSPKLHIHLLGEFRVYFDNQTKPRIDRPRQQALLAHLLLNCRALQARRHLAFTFWPDSSEQQAHTNLRKLFFQLRQALPDADTFLFADSQNLGWRSDAPFTLDVAQLEQALTRLEQPSSIEAPVVEQVLALYCGELLPTCYDEWLLPMRRALHERVINTLADAIDGLEEQGLYKAALRAAEHLLRLDPLHEASYRQLMRLRTISGDRAGALRAYHECAGVLQQELDVAPSPETQQIYEQILRGTNIPSTVPPVSASRVPSLPVAPSFATTPLTAVISELVGRQREASTLRATWRQVMGGNAQMVLISGEAGIGKSRLSEELRRWVAHQGEDVVTASTRAYAAQGALSYAPIASLLRTEVLRSRLGKLDHLWLGEIARILPELLVTIPELAPPQPMTERWQRLRFFEALVRGLFVDEQPLLLVCDDLQWYDEDTLEWLQYLLHNASSACLLVVGTVRHEEINESHPVVTLQMNMQRANRFSNIELASLSAEETARLAVQLTGDELTVAQKQWIYQRSEGNPLFIVEMVRAGFDEQVYEGNRPEELPKTIQAVIQARLAQLSPTARKLAQVAATIGRAFTVEVLAAASDTSEDELVQGLDELWQRRIVREQQATYDFSHDTLREVAFRQQSPMRRRLLHRHIGEALTRLYATNPDSIVGELASHAERAGDLEQAIVYLRRAAQISQSVASYPEVAARLRRALELIKQLKLGKEDKIRQELALLLPLGATLIPLRGYGNPEVEAVYRRAHELCIQLGDDPYLMPTLAGLSLFYMLRGELRQGLITSRQFLSLAERSQDEGLVLEAHSIVGPILMYLGEFSAAAEHLEQAVALYDVAKHGDHAHSYGQDPAVASLVCLATTLWHLGHHGRSHQALQDALALAKQISHQYTLALAYGFAAHLYHMRRQPVEAQAFGELGVQLTSRHGFQYLLMVSIMLHGWGTIQQRAVSERPSQAEQTVALMQEAFGGFKQTGAGLFRGYYGSVIVEAQMAIGALDAAVNGLDEALGMADVNDDQFWLAELHRLRGELWLLQEENEQGADTSRLGQVEAEFLDALYTAQRQESHSLELRAATSLARLWMIQAQNEKAYALLKSKLDWFTDGFDIHDLQVAMKLLEHLSAQL